MKEVIRDKVAKKTVRGSSVAVRQEVGALIMALQRGLSLGMPQARAIRAVHQNAFKLRIKDKSGIYRVFYISAEKDKIYIPHAFVKKTQKTPQKEIDTAKKRLKRLLDEN